MRRRRARTALNPSLLLSVAAVIATQWSLASGQTIHTVFTTECDSYFNWQALGFYHSYQKSGQKGPVTRLLSCTEERLKHYKDIDGVPTHIAPSWSIHPRTGDAYSGINKPVAVKDWLEKVNPPEDYVLIIDSDTVLRKAFTAAEMGLEPGWAVSGFYGYLKGVNNKLAEKHIPQVPPRNDTLAGPRGRRSDQVGGFTFMGKEDLKRMAPDWVSITEDVRADPEAWTLSGDVFTTHPGDKPWIAEMYGYSYGAAKANIWHHTNDRVMLYPGYLPMGLKEAPNVLHYGIKFEIKQPAFSFDKHWYRDFDPLLCPPWDKKTEAGLPTGGLFPNPPHPKELQTKGLERLRDLLAIETMSTINEALCLRHVTACQPSQELDERCHAVFDLAKAVEHSIKGITGAPAEEVCEDDMEMCSVWAAANECETNPSYMQVHCKKSCKLCGRLNDRQARSASKSQKTRMTAPEAEDLREAKLDAAKRREASRDTEDETSDDAPDERQNRKRVPGVINRDAAEQKPRRRRIPEDVLQDNSEARQHSKRRGPPRLDPDSGELHERTRRKARQDRDYFDDVWEEDGDGSAGQHSGGALARAQRVQRLRQACHSNTHYSLKQVNDCINLASQGKPYKPKLGTQRPRVTQKARPNMAGEEQRKTAPGTDKSTRKLGEGLRRLDREDWEEEGGHMTFVILGVVVIGLVLVGKVIRIAARRRGRSALGKGL